MWTISRSEISAETVKEKYEAFTKKQADVVKQIMEERVTFSCGGGAGLVSPLLKGSSVSCRKAQVDS